MTQFRRWLDELWMENCEEHDQYHLPRYSMQEYFQKYKWWLKREYQYQKRKQ